MTDNGQLPLKQQSLKINNSGSQSLAWTIQNKPAWLSFESMSGILGPNTSINVTATASTAGLTAGITYNANVQVTSSTAGVVGSPASAPATLTYLQNPALFTYLPIVSKPGAAATYPSTVAVMVGIDKYLHLTDPSIAESVGLRDIPKDTNLKHTKDDVDSFNNILTWASTSDSGGGIKAITRTDAQATKLGIRQAFAEAKAVAGPATRILFFYSGHGGMWNGHLVLLPYETDPQSMNIEEFFIDTELDGLLDQFSGQSIVILDTCQSGGGISNLSQSGRLILTAAEADESSLETDELNQGVFTYFLNMGFLDPTADTNSDGWVSIEEAFLYGDGRVTTYSAGYSNAQHPVIDDRIAGQVNLTRP